MHVYLFLSDTNFILYNASSFGIANKLAVRKPPLCTITSLSSLLLFDYATDVSKKPARPFARNCGSKGCWNYSFNRVTGRGLIKSNGTVANKKIHTSHTTTSTKPVAPVGQQPKSDYVSCVHHYRRHSAESHFELETRHKVRSVMLHCLRYRPNECSTMMLWHC
jgi:hypothetical protein